MTSFRCEHVVKLFDGVHALDGVSLALPATGIAAIIGPNGAGKTTLLNVLTGFLRPDSGRCFLGERETTRMAPHHIARLGVARTFQDLRLITLVSVLDNVVTARPNQRGERFLPALIRHGVKQEETANTEKALELLIFVGLAEQAQEPAGELSYGEQKLLTLAVCLATDARLLLLDEPVAGVAPQKVEQILGLLRQLRDSGKQVVFIEHCRPYEPWDCPNCGQECSPVLVLPSMTKDLSSVPEIAVMWQSARHAIEQAESLFVFGFSFPMSDALFSHMVKKAICQTRRLKRVAVVDVNPGAIIERIQNCIPDACDVVVTPFSVEAGVTPTWLVKTPSVPQAAP